MICLRPDLLQKLAPLLRIQCQRIKGVPVPVIPLQAAFRHEFQGHVKIIAVGDPHDREDPVNLFQSFFQLPRLPQRDIPDHEPGIGNLLGKLLFHDMQRDRGSGILGQIGRQVGIDAYFGPEPETQQDGDHIEGQHNLPVPDYRSVEFFCHGLSLYQRRIRLRKRLPLLFPLMDWNGRQ